MDRRKFFVFICLIFTVVAFSWGIDRPVAQAAPCPAPFNAIDPVSGYCVPDHFTTPNWANSPPLRKFVDNVAGLTAAGANNLGQYIPIAVPDNTSFPGSDYYEIALVEYREQMHSDLPALNNADKLLATAGGTKLRGYVQEVNGVPVDQPHYLGPIIIAQKDRPVRIKFTNRLPTGSGGNLFIPRDNTIMGSGNFEIDYDPVTKVPGPMMTGEFSQNRATLHLHGGRNPWISDGTAHQWITPAGEATPYPQGVSTQNVPDMTSLGCDAANDGCQTFYWTNQQSARLMFYHDHAYGITRLNVYIGEAAGYLITDTAEEDALAAAGVPGTLGTAPDLAHMIPLVIQDKTFVDNNSASPTYVLKTDPTWAWGSSPGTPFISPVATPVHGDLWLPHVYVSAENPYSPDFMNPYGRWFYGPWFFPATPICGSHPDAVPPLCITQGPIANPYALLPGQYPEIPGTPNPSWGAEAFMDTMVVNGTAYPTITLQPQAYRFRILSAGNDRFLNLQLYKATSIVDNVFLTSGGTGYTSAPTVTIIGDGTGATAKATVDTNPFSPTFRQVTAVNLATVGSGYTTAAVAITGGGGTGATAAATVYTGQTEVGMVPAVFTAGFPDNWPSDGREGGVPDPATRGPAFIQIGTEGGLLPAPVVRINTPITWNLDPTTFDFGVVNDGTLILGPAERADVIVDFSNYAGQTLILYNDAPTAFPALVPQYDYYTGAPDRTEIGGMAAIPPGFGPNIRTVMQIKIAGTGGTAPPDDYNAATLIALDNAFRSTPGTPGLFARSQDNIVVGQSAYDSAYNATFPTTFPNWGLPRIQDESLSFQQVDNTFVSNLPMKLKAIHDEMGATFDDYGRMAAKLGLEVPFTNAATQNFVLQNFVDPPTEVVKEGEVQIWKIIHNGVDTHPIHFHLFDVQVLGRVAWDGGNRGVDSNELGWKDTVRINPLQTTFVALKPVAPQVPFAMPESIRPLNPTAPLGSDMGFSQVDITDGGNLVPPMTNQLWNFGYEYTWHCHILAHEENDMMRPVVLMPPGADPVIILNPFPASPQSPGTQVTFAAGATGSAGPYEYNFWFRSIAGSWVEVQPYSKSSTWTWDTAGLTSGTYVVAVHTRSVGSTAPTEAATFVTYDLLTPPAVTLSSNPPDETTPGTSVIFTGVGSGGSGTFEYNFWLRSIAGSWVEVQPYSTTSTWTWDTASLTPGTYVVAVHIRNIGSTAPSEAATFVTYNLLSAIPPATGVTLSANPQVQATAGTSVSFTGVGSGGSGTFEYQFWLNVGGTWSVVQDYSAGATWTWNTTGVTPALYPVAVKVRSAGSTAVSEASAIMGYVIN